jgi:hypothetical protein
MLFINRSVRGSLYYVDWLRMISARAVHSATRKSVWSVVMKPADNATAYKTACVWQSIDPVENFAWSHTNTGNYMNMIFLFIYLFFFCACVCHRDKHGENRTH